MVYVDILCLNRCARTWNQATATSKGGKNSAVSRVGETNLGIIDIPERRLTFGPLQRGRFLKQTKTDLF
jgi:hypothetical protein